LAIRQGALRLPRDRPVDEFGATVNCYRSLGVVAAADEQWSDINTWSSPVYDNYIDRFRHRVRLPDFMVIYTSGQLAAHRAAPYETAGLFAVFMLRYSMRSIKCRIDDAFLSVLRL